MASNTVTSDGPDTRDSMASTLAKTWLRQYMAESNFPDWTKTQTTITEPLLLPDERGAPAAADGRLSLKEECGCLLCDETFTLPGGQPRLLTHLFNEHNLVIGEVNMVADLPAYIKYWKNKFQAEASALETYCAVMKVKPGDDSEQDPECVAGPGPYYFLSDVLTEDKELRLHLQMNKLQHVLDVQERERNAANFDRSCLFCRSSFQSPKDLFNHMAFNHNFSVGQPDNLVFVSDLLDLLERRLNDLVCIFCEKVFKNRDVLKEHMRKKSHKKINPRNEAYDKFYIVNYLEFGKTWSGQRKQTGGSRAGASGASDDFDDELPTGFDYDDYGTFTEDEEDDSKENDWSDWRGDLSGGAVCLFCPANYTEVNDLFHHLKVVHAFDYVKIKSELGGGLTFYQQVKLINFIRRQVYLNKCVHCNDQFDSKDVLLEHMGGEEGHMNPPEDDSEWNQSQYLFPTYENDNLLCVLEDVGAGVVIGGGGQQHTPEEALVIAEDIEIKESILFEEEFRNSLLSKSDRNQTRRPFNRHNSGKK